MEGGGEVIVENGKNYLLYLERFSGTYPTLRISFFQIFVNMWLWFDLTEPGYSARILALCYVGGKSHFNFHEEMMRNLADTGHQVTMISPFSLSRPHKNLTVINSRNGRKIDVKLLAAATSVENSWFTNFVNTMNYFSEPDCRHIMSMEEVIVSFPNDKTQYMRKVHLVRQISCLSL